jgi:hypothetical protein
MKILITGATGLIGKEVGKVLARDGHEIVVISRDRNKARMQCPFPCAVVEGDLLEGPLCSPLLNGIEGVIHLMGEPVVEGRWTEDKKRRLINSRVTATENLRQSIQGIKVLVAASAIGIYGHRGDEILTEASKPDDDFLALLCRRWEDATGKFTEDGVRVVQLRTGIVLSRHGGALPEMILPFRLGVGGPIAGGSQWMSWIHLDDMVNLYVQALNSPAFSGAYNAVATHPVRNQEFSEQLAKILHRPGFIPTPRFALKLLFGEKADVLTASQRVSNENLLKTGFQFRHIKLETALAEELAWMAAGEELLEAEQYVPLPPDRLFPFFAEADNLGKLTPPTLNFQVKSMSTPVIEEGSLIEYRLKLRGIPMKWLTRIEEWSPPTKFVDNQLKGPYQLWHHTHSFEKLGSGTLMTDRVRFRLPLGFAGWLGGSALVRRDVEKIFRFRRQVVDELFAGGESRPAKV